MESEVSRSIEEQLSAFLDGELPNEELQLLVRRLERDGEYRATLARYSLIGNVLRNDPIQSSEGFRGRIMAAIDNEDSATNSSNAVAAAATGKSWFKPFAAAAVLVLVFSGVVGVIGTDELSLSGPGVVTAVNQSADVIAGRPQGGTASRQRAALARDRMTSYLVSHGEYARRFQGGMTDSRIFVQQASFEQ